MSHFGNYFHEFNHEGYEDSTFIGLAMSISNCGDIDDLKDLCEAYQEYKKATAVTVTKEITDNL